MATEVPQIPLSTARSYAYQALVSGTDAAPMHGKCMNPRDVPLRGVETLLPKQLATVRHDPFVDWYDEDDRLIFVPGLEPDEPQKPEVMTAYVRTRCRKCEECLRHRRRLWTARAMAETRNALRTWFGTLTVSPDRRFQAMMLAERDAVTRRAERLDQLTASEQLRAITRQLTPEVTRWLKRVRQQSKASLRYLLVVEPHKDGFPHFHLLLHETSITPVSKRILEDQWRYGFSSWRLVPTGEMRQVSYVCKYLTKSAQTRVRASRHYGQGATASLYAEGSPLTLQAKLAGDIPRLSGGNTLPIASNGS